ncbi:helix-turn-helix domain-containing protein [Paraburkholderia sacchari]|uniref:helix-turn-helix domain-containing protein n=1 Tax=Paraburkholderia sacchari TaxID=159450 RepID=UPI001BCFE48D|nr:helix-turn-helix domain-containing protein [Paraburkholderia sacchari]
MVTDEKIAFSERLNKVLDDVGFAPKGRGRQVQLGERMGVSQKGARKWLEGEAIPETVRLIEIAKKFGASFEWLATGRGDPYGGSEHPLPPLSQTASEIMAVVDTLTESQKKDLLAQITEQSKRNEQLLEELNSRPLAAVPGKPRPVSRFAESARKGATKANTPPAKQSE